MDREDRVKAIVIAATVIGGVILAAALYRENVNNKERQAAIERKIEKQKPLENEEAEWKEKDAKWNEDIRKKEQGDKCMLVTVNSIDKSVYEIIYPRMKELGYHGTFVLKDGELPGEKPENMTLEQFNEMIQNGWSYAIGITAASNADDMIGWTKALDTSLARWKEHGIENPGILVCQEEQYQKAMREVLPEKGITHLTVIRDEQISFPGNYDETYFQMESIFLKEVRSNVTTMMREAALQEVSLGVSLNKVVKQVTDKNEDLSIEKFDKFMEQMKEMGESGYRMISYKEYMAYRTKCMTELKALKAEYEKFQSEKKERLDEIRDEREKIEAR